MYFVNFMMGKAASGSFFYYFLGAAAAAKKKPKRAREGGGGETSKCSNSSSGSSSSGSSSNSSSSSNGLACRETEPIFYCQSIFFPASAFHGIVGIMLSQPNSSRQSAYKKNEPAPDGIYLTTLKPQKPPIIAFNYTQIRCYVDFHTLQMRNVRSGSTVAIGRRDDRREKRR